MTPLSSRAGLISISRGFFILCTTLGGYACGSPLPRSVLGVLLMMSTFCMRQCHQWQRTACLCAVFTLGPYSELLDIYSLAERVGADSPAYAIAWLDAFVFSSAGRVPILLHGGCLLRRSCPS